MTFNLVVFNIKWIVIILLAALPIGEICAQDNSRYHKDNAIDQNPKNRTKQTKPKQVETTLKISTDFPGGNIKVDSIIGNTVYVQPDLRDNRTSWFYWYFSATSTKTDSITFVFNRRRSLTALGPLISTDKGMTWNWFSQKPINIDSFSYSFKPDEEVYFSIAPPYLQANFDNFMRVFKHSSYIKMDTLCITPKGRAVERLIISSNEPSSVPPLKKVLLTARHHACEAMANYILEGVIETILTSNDINIVNLRNNVEIWIIPFMDKDGVEQGDQGKNRNPFDHNRDYNDKSIYASTDALKKQVLLWTNANGILDAALDVHCPNIKGGYNETIHFPGLESKEMENKQYHFIDLIKKNNRNSLLFNTEKAMIPFGTAWNTAKNYRQGKSFHQWASALPNVGLVTAIEIPYAINDGQVLTNERVKGFGADLTYALAEYILE